MAEREPYKFEAHTFTLRVGGKQYCTGCGLVGLSNEFTAWAVRMGCNHKNHPSYENKRFDTTNIF